MKTPGRARRLAGGPPLAPWVIAAAAAVAAIAFWNSLHYGLAQDAFTLLGRVHHLAPRPAGVWRLVSYDVYFRAMDALFGLEPLPYRIVGLALHVANAAMLAALALRLGLSPAAAFAASMFFAAHNAHFEALFAVASVGEPMAGGFLLLAFLAALPPADRPPSRGRALAATGAFAAALLSKETVVLFPAVLWLASRLRPNTTRAAVIPAAALSVLYLILFWVTDPFGSLRSTPGANPYQPHWGPGMLSAWSTYAAWAFHLTNLFEADLHDRVAGHPEGWLASAIVAAALAMLAWRARREPKPGAPLAAGAIGAGLYAALIAPVLPLATHAFHFYLYLPLLGLAWALGAAWDGLVPPRARGLAWLIGAWVAFQGVGTVRGMEVVPLRETGLPFMGSVRRAQTAGRVLQALPGGQAALPESLAMLGPDALSPPGGRDTTQLGAFLFNDVAGALDEGNGIRLRFPHVKRVSFYGDLGPWLDQADVVVFDYSGGLMRGPAAWLYLRRAQVAWEAGDVGATAAAVRQAEEMTRLWIARTTGAWQREGLDEIRRQALAMIEAEGPRARPAGDARLAARGLYLRALAGIAERAR